MTNTSAPGWMADWPAVAPRPVGPWAVADGRRWGALDPEAAIVRRADPRIDRALPGLAVALDLGDLVAYRPGRRAVVVTPRRRSFVKVVRPTAAARVVEAHLAAGAGDFASPDVLDVATDGRLELSTVVGPRLHDVIRRPQAAGVGPVAVEELAELIAAVGAMPGARALPSATLDAPDRWIATVGRIEPRLVDALEATAATLPTVTVAGPVVVHGDLHDKNVIVTGGPGGRRRLGVIDLDGLSLGVAELDVANLAVHLALRQLQAGRPVATARTARDELIAASVRLDTRVDPDVTIAIARHTAFRLACLYRCRPAGRHLMPSLLALAATVCGG